ncbi:MAG: hypothetical protein KGY78_07400, partial [Anaerolineae bacterium]|nr:hypothetical protein [Anaerolineae bacterium]
KERCHDMVQRSLALATALAPVIGYDAAAELAKEAHRTGRTVRDVAQERGPESLGLSSDELDELLAPYRMTEPGLPDDLDDLSRRS